jgi:predicted RecA/RadA family phage recombinase
MALRDIPANTTGAIQGYDSLVFDFLKFAGEVINLWDTVYWDDGTKTATKTVGYSEARIGYCIRPAIAGDERVRVKIAPPLT